MNVDTGELRRLLANEEVPDGFIEVPSKYRVLSQELLGDSNSVIVPRNNPLIKAMKKKRNKMAKKSRNLNRGNK